MRFTKPGWDNFAEYFENYPDGILSKQFLEKHCPKGY
jgi:hypothetical protein